MSSWREWRRTGVEVRGRGGGSEGGGGGEEGKVRRLTPGGAKAPRLKDV